MQHWPRFQEKPESIRYFSVEVLGRGEGRGILPHDRQMESEPTRAYVAMASQVGLPRLQDNFLQSSQSPSPPSKRHKATYGGTQDTGLWLDPPIRPQIDALLSRP